MDVRCEKCQTEYELDESRLKPGGVTVKCTNCGHMFKIRKRTPTNVNTPTVPTRADSVFGVPEEGPTTVERQWVIRLENGEQKTCRELATLQQWIVSNVVSRESLISRTGKTWKRLGDIAELAQYFAIADEARTGRAEKTTKPQAQKKPVAGTMLGIGSAADTDEATTTGNYRSQNMPQARPATPPPPLPGQPPAAKTPPMGSNVTARGPGAAQPKTPTGPNPVRAAATPAPPPPQQQAPVDPLGPTRLSDPRPAQPTPAPPKAPPPDARSTAAWASDPIKASGVAPSGPYVGKLAAIPDEPAFAGRVRVSPSDESSFETGRVSLADDDDDLMPRRHGSRAGLIILVMTLLVGAGAAAIVYVLVIKKDGGENVATPTPSDAAVVAPDASLVVTPVIDAAEVPQQSPLDIARGELAQNTETRLRAALDTLPKDDPATQAVRANIGAAIAQSLVDRANLAAEKAEAEKLRKESKTIVLDAATAAQRAHKATADDPGANIAMANVLRLQGKSLKDMQRYLDAAKPKAGVWARDLALCEALVYARDGKLDDARKLLEAIDSGEGKLETSNDVRARFHLALIAFAQNRFPDAKASADQILAAQPEHLGAKALVAKLETKTSNVDPLPPEDPKTGSGSAKPPVGPSPIAGGTYDQLLQRANKAAESSCAKAMEIYAKALEEKPNGVEALTGQGYCHIDAKQFASAFSKFRSALAISSKYEPALWGVAEAYQQQGRREQALDAYKAYLEVYPGSAKAQKQIERLTGTGAGSAPTPPPQGDGSAQPQKDPPKDPPKDPTPTPVPVGSGSG
jgi:predicted Zn finger-like uncharacterized protein